MTFRLSVVIATYNRQALLLDLLRDLAQQTIPPSDYEVIVVDDGSKNPCGSAARALALPYALRVIEQPNAGPAAARHNGILAASADVIVILDDDMHVREDFLACHLDEHERGATVVQGYIAPPPEIDTMPLFERFHADQLERFVRDVAAGREQVRGIHVCTGNVSFRRADYLATGGFDITLGRSEDRDIGIRLEKAGAKLVLSRTARSAHRSDHDKLEVWLRRAFNYGVYDLRIAHKHRDVPIADPWRFVWLVSPVSRPFVLGAAVVPSAMRHLTPLVAKIAEKADRLGFARAGVAGITLAYGIEYFRGVRREAGTLSETLRDLVRYARLRGEDAPSLKKALRQNLRALMEDYRALMLTRAKYNNDVLRLEDLPLDLVRRVGVQMMLAIRLMHMMRDARMPLFAKVLSRMIRHLYAAEVHWDAEVAPGVVLIHGNGLVLSHAAKVGKGCILFHNVTLGEGIDAATRTVGAPTLEADVHVGPGATLLGPITIGEGSKVMAGAIVTRSVPPRSLVRPSDAVVTSRQRRDNPLRPVRPNDLTGLAANDDVEREERENAG